MSKSIKRQRDNFPKTPVPSVTDGGDGIVYPVPVHPAFLAKLTAVWEEGQRLQREIQALQLRFNDIMDLAKTVQVEDGQIDDRATVRDIKVGWILPPPEPQTGTQTPVPEPEASRTQTAIPEAVEDADA